MARNPNDIHRSTLTIHERVAIVAGNILGSPWTIYAFSLLSLISLPAVIESRSLVLIISWITQTFIQLVALAILQAKAVIDGRHAETVADETHANAKRSEEMLEEILTILKK